MGCVAAALRVQHRGHFHCGCCSAILAVMPTQSPSNQRSQLSH
jgi:hypothetical protein